MNYQVIHDNIINRAKANITTRIENRSKGYYFEAHHIIPRCKGGTGTCQQLTHENIALLTAKEHYIVHLLLTKIYPEDPKIYAALWGMVTKGKDKRIKISSNTYEAVRKEWASITSKAQLGVARGPMSDSHKKKISESSKGTKKTMTEKRIQSAANRRGQPYPESAKEKIRLANKGRTGHTHTEETKLKISAARQLLFQDRQKALKKE